MQWPILFFAPLFGQLFAASLAFAVFVPAHPPIGIRVRIAETIPRVLIRGFDVRIYETQRGGQNFVVSADRSSEWEFTCYQSDKASDKSGGKTGMVRARRIHSPDKISILELHEPVSIHSPVGFLHFGNSPYRDELRIYSSGSHCEVINDVDLEKYLDGLVNSEFSAKWNEESIAAQVVAGRTYAYHQILEAKGKKSVHFDVDATVKDQVYNGSMKEDFHASRVVTRTRGQVLTSGMDGDYPVPLKAFYHSTCGGITELPENVWGKGKSSPGFKQAVTCPYCVESPRFRWSLDLKESELIQKIRAGVLRSEKWPGVWPGVWPGAWEEWPKTATKILERGKLLDIRVGQVDGQRRVLKIVTSWADGMNVVDLPIPGPLFRDWIGVSRLRSTSFHIIAHKTDRENAWNFRGQGNGHGVGMCQWGAKVMGQKGYKMEAILKFYYPDAILKKLW